MLTFCHSPIPCYIDGTRSQFHNKNDLSLYYVTNDSSLYYVTNDSSLHHVTWPQKAEAESGIAEEHWSVNQNVPPKLSRNRVPCLSVIVAAFPLISQSARIQASAKAQRDLVWVHEALSVFFTLT